MRTKVVDSRELWEGLMSITNALDAVEYRVRDLTGMLAFYSRGHRLTRILDADIFSQQKQDVEKQFQNFAYGIVIDPFTVQFILRSDASISQFRYFNSPKALWSGDYVRNLDPRTTPYNDANEDQNIKIEDVLKFQNPKEPSLDYWVYDGHSVDESVTSHDAEPPLKDMFVLSQFYAFYSKY
jgi:hypothetical protein